MEKDRDTLYNGSYLFRLNEELSGQAKIDPYFINSGSEIEQETTTQSVSRTDMGFSPEEQAEPGQ